MKKTVGITILVLLLAGAGFVLFQNAPETDTETTIPPQDEQTSRLTPDESDAYPVAYVIDGDTVVLRMQGKNVRVRLIGIDAPENGACYSNQATSFLRLRIGDESVRVETDVSQGQRDKYGRLLAFLYAPDGTFVNRELLAEGFAKEMTFPTPHRYATEFRQDEQMAREQERGLWGPGVCDTR